VWQPRHKGETHTTRFFHREIHYTDDPVKTPEWAKVESLKYGGMDSVRWQREMEINWGVYAGQRVWPMLSRKYHHLPIGLDEGWAIYRIIDHGIRHPTCCLWVGVNRNGDRHYFKEYYATDRSIAINCKHIINLSGDNIIDTYIDPSTRKRVNFVTSDATSEKKGIVKLVSIYRDAGISCSLADNSAAGYDKVTDGLLSRLARYVLETGEMPEYLKEMAVNQDALLMLSSKPAITFDLRFTNRAYQECQNLRWKELSGEPTQHSEPEKTVDVKDEGPDCVRYGIQSKLIWRRPIRKFPANSPIAKLQEKHLHRQYKSVRKWA
jgi:hypothetical protein